MTTREEYKEEARIERAIKNGTITECHKCGKLTIPYFSDYQMNYGPHLDPFCEKCQIEENQECPRCGEIGEKSCRQEPDLGVCGGLWEILDL